MSRPQEYQEKISTIKSVFEMLDYSEEYDGHRYRALQNELVSTMAKMLDDSELSASEVDMLFKLMSIILGHYIDCLEDYEEFVPMVKEFLKEGKITPEQWEFFKGQLVFNP